MQQSRNVLPKQTKKTYPFRNRHLLSSFRSKPTNSSYWKFPIADLLAQQPTWFRVAFPRVPCWNSSLKKEIQLGRETNLLLSQRGCFSNREEKRELESKNYNKADSVQGWTSNNGNNDEQQARCFCLGACGRILRARHVRH